MAKKNKKEQQKDEIFREYMKTIDWIQMYFCMGDGYRKQNRNKLIEAERKKLELIAEYGRL